MRKLLFVSLLSGIVLAQVFSQTIIEPKLLLDEDIPVIDGIKDGLYDSTASAYVNYPGTPNYGDLGVPDVELKFYAAWNQHTLYLLFRHIDDILITGEADDGSVLDGLENRDATTLYLYLGEESTRLNEVLKPDSATFWLTWTWETNLVEASLKADGNIVYSYEEFFTECVQHYNEDEKAWYSEMAIDLNALSLSAGLTAFNVDSTASIGFDVELNENDKEIGSEPFGIQTRAFFGDNLWDSAKVKPSQWGIMTFSADTIVPTPIRRIHSLEGISVYPNPVRSGLTIQSETNLPLQGRIMDNTGRILRDFYIENQREVIDVEDLEYGFYLLQLISDDKRFFTQKFIKQ